MSTGKRIGIEHIYGFVYGFEVIPYDYGYGDGRYALYEKDRVDPTADRAEVVDWYDSRDEVVAAYLGVLGDEGFLIRQHLDHDIGGTVHEEAISHSQATPTGLTEDGRVAVEVYRDPYEVEWSDRAIAFWCNDCRKMLDDDWGWG